MREIKFHVRGANGEHFAGRLDNLTLFLGTSIIAPVAYV